MEICRMNYHCGILIQAFKNEGTLCIGPNTGVNICSYVTMVTQKLVFSRYSSMQNQNQNNVERHVYPWTVVSVS
jgi:hypothetical protein